MEAAEQLGSEAVAAQMTPPPASRCGLGKLDEADPGT